MVDDQHPDAVRLVRMANQIAEFFAGQPSPDPGAGVVDHLKSFWTPKMRRDILAYLDGGGEGLSVLAKQSVERLRPTNPR